MQEKTMWRNVHLSVIDIQIQEKKYDENVHLLCYWEMQDCGERETHIHGWPMLSYLSRFQILDGSPALEHLVSMRKSLIHLPSVPDPLPSLPLDTLLNFLPARLLLHHHPHKSSTNLWFRNSTFGPFSPSLSIFHRRHSCCHATYNKCAFGRARLSVLHFG